MFVGSELCDVSEYRRDQCEDQHYGHNLCLLLHTPQPKQVIFSMLFLFLTVSVQGYMDNGVSL